MMKLIIPDPCKQNWNEMQPVSDGRFCSSCAKNVVDFTSFTDAQLASYFKSYPKNVCGKLSSGQLDRNLASMKGSSLSKAASVSKSYSIRQSTLFVGLGLSLLNMTSCIPPTAKVTLGEVETTETRKADTSTPPEKFRSSEEIQLNDPNLKDLKPEVSEPGDPQPGDPISEELIPEGTKPKDHDIKTKGVQKEEYINKIPANVANDHLLIRTQSHDLLPARVSGLLANSSQFVDTIITGIVKDTSGLPIDGASVAIYGSPIGVVTNTEGRFSLIVSPEQINDEIKLSIEYIGYNVKLLTVQGSYSKDLNIFLVPVEYALLGDVVIVGGIYVKPTIWQRIKNMITFWK
jgi:hypothetical protein